MQILLFVSISTLKSCPKYAHPLGHESSPKERTQKNTALYVQPHDRYAFAKYVLSPLDLTKIGYTAIDQFRDNKDLLYCC